MNRFDRPAYALLRIVTGFLFLWHGVGKVFGYPEPIPDLAWHVHWIAGPVELIGGVLVMIGLFTRIAAFICSGQMAFAYFMVHAKGGFLPTENGGELAVLYCFVFLFIAAHGAGSFSVDGRRPA